MGRLSNDHELLRQYVETGSETAFAQLVMRHSNMVYSAVVRQLGRNGSADEVTQAVFVLLMRKAADLSSETVIAAWLFKATRYTVLNVRKMEARRRKHERKAGEMALQCIHDESGWKEMSPLLDEAISRLQAPDRSAIVLRFLERRSFAEVGLALGVNENAAQMRVHRALEKMRAFFGRRGVVFTAAVIATLLTTNATEAAPPHLMQALTMSNLRALRAVESVSRSSTFVGRISQTLAWPHIRAAAGLLIATTAAITGGLLFAAQVSGPWPGEWKPLNAQSLSMKSTLPESSKARSKPLSE